MRRERGGIYRLDGAHHGCLVMQKELKEPTARRFRPSQKETKEA
jgi:hypothetical protein